MPWELVVKQPSILENLAISTLIKWYISPVRKCVYPIMENPQIETTIENVVSTQTDIGRKYFSAIPKKFHDKLIAETLQELSPITENLRKVIAARQTPRFCGNYIMNLSEKGRKKLDEQRQRDISFQRNLSLQMKLVGQMIEIFLNEKVTSLELQHHQMTSFALSFSKFNLLVSLTSLTINCHYKYLFRYYQSEEIKSLILEILKGSHHLKYLELEIVEVDDEILNCIVNNCKLIKELDFSSSNVMDRSVHILTQMPNLKTFYVDALNVNCFKTVMLSCERVEDVCAEASIDSHAIKNLYTCIHEIASQADNSNKLTKVKSYSGVRNTSEQILLLAKMCPVIDRLILYGCRNNHIDFKALAGYSNLSHLHLEYYSFYGNHVKEALDEIGHNMKSLSLVRDNQIDLNALFHISQKCPNLESLILINCIFTNYVPEYEENKLTVRPFTNLKTLHLFTVVQQDDKLMIEVLNFLLSNCLNVEYVDIGYSTNMISTFSTVDVRRLKCLKELKIRVK